MTDLATEIQRVLVLRYEDPTLKVVDVRSPEVSGLSNETTLVRATRGPSSGPSELKLILKRSTPTPFAHVLPIVVQARLMSYLSSHSEVRVPEVVCDGRIQSSTLGPYMIMHFIPGDVPPSVPSLNASGMLFDMPEDQRRRAYLAGIDAMASVHGVRLDDTALRQELVESAPGSASFAASLSAFRHQYENLHPYPDDTLEAAFDWLGNQRVHDGPLTLCWGDARLGNLVFEGTSVAAVLDWEMASISSPLSDLAWWLALDDFQSEGMKVPRLSGFPDRDEILQHYEQVSGTPIPDMRVYEVFARLRMAIVSLELQRLFEAAPDFGKRPGRSLAIRFVERALSDL